MKASKYKFFIFVNLIILFNSFNCYYLAQTKQNSIIKLFWLQSVKVEMMKAEMVYSEKLRMKLVIVTTKNLCKLQIIKMQKQNVN